MPQIKRLWFQVNRQTRDDLIRAAAGETDWPVVLVGPAGSGKTCAALALMDRTDGIYRSAPDLVARIADWMMTAQHEQIRDFWRFWQMFQLAILDEVGGRGTVSDHHYETIKRCLDLREGKPLIVISNLPLARIATLYDDRIASRLAGGTVIEMSGKDRRVTPSTEAPTCPARSPTT